MGRCIWHFSRQVGCNENIHKKLIYNLYLSKSISKSLSVCGCARQEGTQRMGRFARNWVLDEAARESCLLVFLPRWKPLSSTELPVSELFQPLQHVMQQVSLLPHRCLCFFLCISLLGSCSRFSWASRRLRLLRDIAEDVQDVPPVLDL